LTWTATPGAAAVAAAAVLWVGVLAAVAADVEPVVLLELLPQPASSAIADAATPATPRERVTYAS
jgi:hypothetical protein